MFDESGVLINRKEKRVLDLKKEIQYVKGVGPRRVDAFKKLNIYTLQDLITHFPREYEDRTKVTPISHVMDNENVLIEARVITNMRERYVRKNMVIYQVTVEDETGVATITWYNQSYLKNQISRGKKYRFFGKAKNTFGKIDMNSPIFESEGEAKKTGKIMPVYPSTYELPQNTLRRIMENALMEVKELPETLPEYIKKVCNLCNIEQAIKQIHFPNSFKELETARKRLVFEELLHVQLSLFALKNKYMIEEPGIAFRKEVKMSELINQLPFKLTKAQLRVLEEIDSDMESNKAMNRLLQGDVGSRENNCGNDCNL